MTTKELKFLKSIDDSFYKGIISKNQYEGNKTRQIILKKHLEYISSKNELNGSESSYFDHFNDWNDFMKDFH